MKLDQTHQSIAALLSPADNGPNRYEIRPAEWAYIVETVTVKGLGALLLQALQVRDCRPPSFVPRALRAAARSVAQRNGAMMARLEPLLAALNAADIPVMLLKGAALNLTAYESPDLRPMSDVDLLVHERDAARTAVVLKEAGCREGLQLIRADFFPRFYYEKELVTTELDPLRIDLHARPLRPLRYARLIDENDFWRAARSVRIGTAQAWVPSPETMLIHLAAHAAFHGFARLIWLLDLKRWVDACGPSIDWARLEQFCNAWHLSLAVRRALTQAEQLFGPIVPEPTRHRLLKAPVHWRDRMTLKQAPRDAISPWPHIITDLLCTPGLRFRLGYIAALLTPDRGHLAEIYPYRHGGWALTASGYRMIRAAARLITGLARRTPLVSPFFERPARSPRTLIANHHIESDRRTDETNLDIGPVFICPGM